jgi:N-methylhydantoinase A
MGIWTSLSLVDVESISAGGGSVGWADARGMLRVGPVSAGALPGPACYGKGGTEPTVTDALVVLGYIDPSRFLGGDIALDVHAARIACETLGRKLGLDANETAWGIRQLALEGMIKAVRALLNARGLDPRTHALISFGGCGSLFTPDIAREIGARNVVVPELASVLSAFGAATADIRRERVQALALSLPCDTNKLQMLADRLRGEVLADLAADGVAERDRSVQFEFDMRFEHQSWELTIPLRSPMLGPEALEQLAEDFRRDYARRFGQGSMRLGAGLELTTMRAAGIGQTIRASLDALKREAVDLGTRAVPVGTREVQLERGAGGRKHVEVYDGSALRPGHRLAGPALIDGADTTIWIPAGSSATVDSRSTLRIEVNA